MPIFELTKNEFATESQVQVYNLSIDGNCQFEAFASNLTKETKSEIKKISISIWQLSANRKPRNRNHIKGKGLEVCRELKTKNLRLYYLILNPYGLVICLGGQKTKQKKDIAALKTLKNKILKYKETHGGLEIVS